MNTETIEQLIDGELPWERLKSEVLPDPKDEGRFEKVRAVLQDRVDWDDPIVLPLNEHLFVVKRDGEYHVKGECGHEFCNADENWKMHCQVRVREDEEEMNEVYPGLLGPDPEWTFQIREYFCPECYQQIDTTAVPAGYPMFKPFDPDIDTFYEEWLGQPVEEALGD